jgi:hypothetical protein
MNPNSPSPQLLGAPPMNRRASPVAAGVTRLDWQPDRDPSQIGRELVAANHVHPPVNCSGRLR